MYACGITVSGEAHIGHGYQALIYDIMRKYLKKVGYDVTYARNYTDVDDKIIAKSHETGIPADEYAAKMIENINAIMEKFHVDDQRWNTELTDGLVYDYCIGEAYILHYIMTNKPWHYELCRGGEIYWSYAKKTVFYDELRRELAAYTDEQKERDRLSAENLCQMAIDETNKEDTFLNIMKKGKLK